MQRAKYAPEFKDEAVKQVIDKGHSVVDVVKRLGIAEGVLYTWVSKFKKADEPQSSDLKAMQTEMAKLKAELRRTTEERDILKKAAPINSVRVFNHNIKRTAWPPFESQSPLVVFSFSESMSCLHALRHQHRKS